MALYSQEQWDSLSEKGQWDVKVALRGPDSYYGETLKWYTTAVIRGHVRKLFRVGGSVNRDLKLVVLPYNNGHLPKQDKTSWNAAHFIEHMHIAAEWLHIPILWVPAILWHSAMSLSHPMYAAQAILEASKTGSPEIDKAQKYNLYNSLSQDSKNLAELKRHLNKHFGVKDSAKNSISQG